MLTLDCLRCGVGEVKVFFPQDEIDRIGTQIEASEVPPREVSDSILARLAEMLATGERVCEACRAAAVN